MALCAEDLTFAYDPRAAPLLDHWSATFEQGRMTAITGPSGRGKSTLLYVLGLMLRPGGGSISYLGENLSDLSDDARSRARAAHFGFVFQDSALDPSRSVLDNVTETALYRRVDRRESVPRARTLLEEFGVLIRAEARPTEISGGQAQRIALCRALLGFPGIVLADEPTGNLDAETKGVVLRALHEYARGGAIVIVVTHDDEVARTCDEIIAL